MAKVPVLAVLPHYAELITLWKDRDVRHYPAPEKYIGKRIAIYASRTAPKKSDLDRINRFLASYKLNPITGKVRGAIVATAILKGSHRVESSIGYRMLNDCHFASMEYYIPGETYFWKLEEIITLDDPISFKASSVVWSSIDEKELDGWL